MKDVVGMLWGMVQRLRKQLAKAKEEVAALQEQASAQKVEIERVIRIAQRSAEREEDLKARLEDVRVAMYDLQEKYASVLKAEKFYREENEVLRNRWQEAKVKACEGERALAILDWSMPSVWHVMSAARLANAREPNATEALSLCKMYNVDVKTYIGIRDILFK